MSDDDEEGPLVELGPGADEPVEGAPIARVASRLQWPIERSRVEQLEGEATVRTPDGPRDLSSVLEELDVTYFDERRTFVDAVRDAVGRGPIPAERSDDAAGDVDDAESDPEGDEVDDGDREVDDGADQNGGDAEDVEDPEEPVDAEDAGDDEELEDPELFDDAGGAGEDGDAGEGDETTGADG